MQVRKYHSELSQKQRNTQKEQTSETFIILKTKLENKRIEHHMGRDATKGPLALQIAYAVKPR